MMRGDPESYQSIAAMMPEEDDHIYLDEACSGRYCGLQAVEQFWYKEPLCADHLGEEIQWDRADMERE